MEMVREGWMFLFGRREFVIFGWKIIRNIVGVLFLVI